MEENKNENIKIVVAGVVVLSAVALTYFGVIKPIFNKLGITRDKEDRKGDKAKFKLSEKQLLSKELYLNNPTRVSITKSQADYGATMIYNAKWGGCLGFCDDEEMAINGIKEAKSLVDISYISNQFSELFKKDMLTYMNSFLEEENYLEIINYINKLKKF